MLTDTTPAPASAASAHSQPAWRSLVLLTALTLLGLGLRLLRLDYVGYWHDEVISIFAARPPVWEIYRSITANDTHPPLYHILLHYWGRLFGYDLLAARLLSVTLSTLCIPAVWLLGRALADGRTGLLAAALMALSPFQVFHGQQARMYPLLTLVTLLTAVSVWEAWRRGGAGRWALTGLALTAGLYTHVYFWFSALGLALWAMYVSVREGGAARGAWAGFIGAYLAAGALVAPFLPTLLGLTGSVIGHFWIPSNTPLDWMVGLAALLTNVRELYGRVPVTVQMLMFLVAASAIGLATLTGLRASGPGSSGWRAWGLLLFAVFTPCVVATVLSLTVRPILLDRSLIGVSGPLFVLLAWAASDYWRPPVRKVAVPMVMGCMLIGLSLTYPVAPRPHSLQPAVDLIFTERRPGEAVILLDWPSFDLTALRYPDATDVYVACTEEAIAGWQRRMTFMRWHTPHQVGPPEAYATKYRRIWVMGTLYTYPEIWDRVISWLDDHGRVVDQRKVGDDPGRILVYELTS